MNHNDISILRLKNQQIAQSGFKTVNEIVSWMCALQGPGLQYGKMGYRYKASPFQRDNN